MKRKIQRGFMTGDAVYAIGIFLLFSGLVLRAIVPANVAKKVGAAATDMEQLDNGASRWGGDRFTGMTGVNVTLLSSGIYIPPEFQDGVARNPWGGNYTVSAGKEQYEYIVSATGIPNADCGQLAARLSKKSATCSSGTVSYTARI